MAIADYMLLFMFIGLAILTSSLMTLFIVLKSMASPYPIIKRKKEEKSFLDPNAIKMIDFPSIDEEPTVNLSVIVPAYEEEARLPIMLDECLQYLEQRTKEGNFSYEVIVVSDGSRDGTVALALKYSKRYTVDKVRVMELVENRGKGGAVRLGMLSARGRYLLFADADGATKFEDFAKLEQRMLSVTTEWTSNAVVIGSRAHLLDDVLAVRSPFRTFLMHGFHFLVWLFAVRKVRDTQCGFKLLTRAAAKRLFNTMHVERWAFDAELLFLAQRLKMPIEEVAVTWHEIAGSKLTPFWSWLQMAFDLFLIWFRYTVGAWQVDSVDKDHGS